MDNRLKHFRASPKVVRNPSWAHSTAQRRDKLGPDPPSLVGEVSCLPLPSSGKHQEEQ